VFKTELVYDKRLIDRHLKRGTIGRADLEKHIAELPDVADKGERLSLDDEEGKPAEEE
jgi:hypothetical protein